MTRLRIALSVDVEDYYMSPESIPVSDAHQFEDRIEIGMEHLLGILDNLRLRATFFFLGCVAEKHPEIVRRVFDAGHEIATHTYDHRGLNTLSPQERTETIHRSMEILREITGAPIVGVRAPMFALRRDDKALFRELADAGIKYDSSINPFATYLYGERGAPLRPYLLDAGEERSLVELPVAAFRFLGKILPVGGGFFLRALPLAYFRWGLRRVRHKGNTPVLYMHPWEFDPNPPDLPIHGKERWIHYRGLRGMAGKTRSLLADCESVLLRDLAQEQKRILQGTFTKL
jgi:polysaccharide deacetylase family protein (PEP-CTERM system associated)